MSARRTSSPVNIARRSTSQHATGSPTYNERLSLRRATAVKRWLTDNAGIKPDRIAVRGYGETRPVAPNGDSSGRARNRRVVVGVR